MKPELSILNKRRKTNGIEWCKVAQGNPEVTGTWGKGLVPSGAAECRTYHVLNDATCVQDCRGNAENTVSDSIPLLGRNPLRPKVGVGILRPDPRNSLPRVSGYLNARLSLFTFFTSNNMSPLPNLRECDDDKLAESPSDSEESLAAKFAERMRRRRELREHEERE